MALKYEHIQPGTRIRAHDHQPREGVSLKYVEGTVVEHGQMHSCDAKALVIDCEVDTTWGSEGYGGKSYTRVGGRVHVPMQLAYDEYDGRVMICTERCDL